MGAGVGSPAGGVLYATTPHEGSFTVDVVVGASVVRTVELDTDDTAVTGWTYTSAAETWQITARCSVNPSKSHASEIASATFTRSLERSL